MVGASVQQYIRFARAYATLDAIPLVRFPITNASASERWTIVARIVRVVDTVTFARKRSYTSLFVYHDDDPSALETRQDTLLPNVARLPRASLPCEDIQTLSQKFTSISVLIYFGSSRESMAEYKGRIALVKVLETSELHETAK